MRIIELINVHRKDTPLYYRKEYAALAVLEFMQQTSAMPVEFVLEHKPLGGVDVRVTIVDDIDYPVVPVVTMLKRHILDLHQQGSLP